MADKKMVHKFQVKFLVKAIIGLDVEASTHEEAIEKAKKVIAGGVYKKGIGLDVLDGHEYLAGFDNSNLWEEA